MQLTFISSKDAEDKHSIHSKSNNIKFTSYNAANEVKPNSNCEKQ